MIRLKVLRGHEGKQILEPLSQLRIEVFNEYPYLYEGSFEYEKKYLDRYFSSEKSVVIALLDGETLVGASTAIHLPHEMDSIKETFLKYAYKAEEVVYFGESILKKKYRGLGYGKNFFAERENFAKSIGGIRYTSFCSVIRNPNDARRPADYASPEFLWKKMGYAPAEGLRTQLEWKEIGELSDSPKDMQFWIKELSDIF